MACAKRLTFGHVQRFGVVVGVLAEGTFACGGQTSLRETSPRDRGDATVDAGRDAGPEATVDTARDAGTDLGTAPGDDTGSGPFVPAACVALPEGGTTDAGDAATSVDAGVNADAEGCADCQPAQVTRVFGSVTTTTTYPACCSGMSACGLVIDGKCYPMSRAGTPAPGMSVRLLLHGWNVWPDRSSGGIRLVPDSADPQPITCRAAAGRHPRACACASCPAEIEACTRSHSCTAVVACRAGRTPESPHDPQGYALADALDACFERAGCMRLTELGVCREACPDGWWVARASVPSTPDAAGRTVSVVCNESKLASCTTPPVSPVAPCGPVPARRPPAARPRGRIPTRAPAVRAKTRCSNARAIRAASRFPSVAWKPAAAIALATRATLAAK